MHEWVCIRLLFESTGQSLNWFHVAMRNTILTISLINPQASSFAKCLAALDIMGLFHSHTYFTILFNYSSPWCICLGLCWLCRFSWRQWVLGEHHIFWVMDALCLCLFSIFLVSFGSDFWLPKFRSCTFFFWFTPNYFLSLNAAGNVTNVSHFKTWLLLGDRKEYNWLCVYIYVCMHVYV